MTDDNDNHLPDLDDMPVEGLHEVIYDLHDAYHAVADRLQWFQDEAMSLAAAMAQLAEDLNGGDRFGRRRDTMRLVSLKLAAISALSIVTSGLDLERMAVDTEFANIANRLEADGLDGTGVTDD